MRNLKYFILIFFFISCKKEVSHIKEAEYKPSKIDSLNTNIAIENFISSKDSTFREFKLKRVQDFHANKFADSIGANKAYYKADFDNNGYQDLFVIGDFRGSGLMYPFAFMSYGKDSIKTIWIKDRHTYLIPKVTRKKNQDFLEVYDFNGKKDILIFKYGGFVNYNEKPSNHSIEKIEFKGSDDVRGRYEISIDANLNASIKKSQGYYEKVITKTVETKLKLKDYNKLVNLLNYMDFANSKENYSPRGTDMPMGELKITYNGGKVKQISDWGMEENYSLVVLYKKLDVLIFSNIKNTAGNSGFAQ